MAAIIQGGFLACWCLFYQELIHPMKNNLPCFIPGIHITCMLVSKLCIKSRAPIIRGFLSRGNKRFSSHRYCFTWKGVCFSLCFFCLEPLNCIFDTFLLLFPLYFQPRSKSSNSLAFF